MFRSGRFDLIFCTVTRYGYDMSYLDSIGRWEVINLVKMKSTEEAKELGVEHRFARGQRSSAAEQEHLFKSECQRIFDLQVAYSDPKRFFRCNASIVH